MTHGLSSISSFDQIMERNARQFDMDVEQFRHTVHNIKFCADLNCYPDYSVIISNVKPILVKEVVV